jgi:hypothetical protein
MEARLKKESACFASAKPWVQTSVHQKKKKKSLKKSGDQRVLGHQPVSDLFFLPPILHKEAEASSQHVS